MVINLVIIFLFFFLSNIFFSSRFSIMENIIIGMILNYIIIMFISLFEISYIKYFLVLKIFIILSLIYFFYTQFNKLKLYLVKYQSLYEIEKIVLLLKITFLIIFINLIFYENIINIILNPLEAGDALAGWFHKAKYFIYNPGIEHWRQISYPNFISSMWSISFLLFDENFNISRIILPFIMFICVITVYSKILKEFNNFLLNSLFLIFILSFYSLSSFGGNFRYSNSGYADFAVASFLMVGFTYLYLSFRNKKFFKKDFLFSCICLGILSSIKTEGLVISFGIMFIMNLYFLYCCNIQYRENFKVIIFCNLIFVLISIFPVLLGQYLQLLIGTTNYSTKFFQPQNLLSFGIISERIPLIFEFIYLALKENRAPGLLFGILILINFFITRKINNILKLIFVMSVFFFSYIILIYLVSNFPLEWHLQTSLNRIFYPYTGLIFSFYFLIINYDYKNKFI